MKKASVIFNKKSGKKRKYPAEYNIIEQLTRIGYDVEILYTPSTGARLIAAEAARYSDLIVASGGDGTIGEVIGGIAESGGNPLLSILPAGTVNDYARALGIPLNLQEAVESLSSPQEIIEADVVAYNDRHAGYLIALGDFMESFTKVASESKKQYGKLAYLNKGIRALAKMKPYEIRIKHDGGEISATTLATIVSSAPSVGSFNSLIPQAELDDGLLHVLNIAESNPKEILEIIYLAARGRITEHKNIRYIRSSHLEIVTDRLEMMNIDGDAFPFEPLDVRLIPGRVRISRPKKS